MLPKKDVASYYGPDVALLPGQLIDCVVTKPPAAADGGAGAAAVAAVTVSHDAVAAAGVKDGGAEPGAGAGAGMTLAGLLPGMLVTAKVRAVLGDGLLVTFLNYFNGGAGGVTRKAFEGNEDEAGVWAAGGGNGATPLLAGLQGRSSSKPPGLAKAPRCRAAPKHQAAPPPPHVHSPGIIDQYHLADPIPGDNWGARYHEGQKLKAGPPAVVTVYLTRLCAVVFFSRMHTAFARVLSMLLASCFICGCRALSTGSPPPKANPSQS